MLLTPSATPAQKPAPAPQRAAEPARPAPADRLPGGVHVVRRGDTLGAIARRYGVSIDALVAANSLAGPNAKLKIGQRLVVPAPGAVAAAPPRAGRERPAVRRRQPMTVRVPAGMFLAIPDFVELLPALAWPVDGTITSPFGLRRRGWHTGIDIQTDMGNPVAASASGVVTASGWEGRYGRVVKIEHLNGLITVYAHNQQNYVGVGERVSAGQVIATVGRTGRATAQHVHFEVRHSGLAYNPLYLLPLPPRVGQVDETDDEEPDADHE